MKVSFDFDSTLTRKDVQLFAKELIDRGFEVWIVTSRFGFGQEPTKTWNDDLFKVASEIGIPQEHIHFTCITNKSEFLKDKDFLFHLDDDNIELEFIKEETDVEPIYLFGNKDWKNDCEKILNKKHGKN